MQEYHLFSGPNPPTVKNEELINNHEKYGFRKVDAAIFRAIKKKAKPENHLLLSQTLAASISVNHFKDIPAVLAAYS